MYHGGEVRGYHTPVDFTMMSLMGIADTDPVGVIVAHPDDETLWAGGTMLLHPHWHCAVFTLCRAGDVDRAPKFSRAVTRFAATGAMADLDDGPEQTPLPTDTVETTILRLVGGQRFRRILTHGPRGEYTWHRRHGEVSQAVIALWTTGQLQTEELWLFAYDDHAASEYPHALREADQRFILPPEVWEAKYHIIREVYGFSAASWEALSTPLVEAFRTFSSPTDLAAWQRKDAQR